jgi:type IV secretory pathway TrbD component
MIVAAVVAAGVVAVWVLALALCREAAREDAMVERAGRERTVDRWNRVGDSFDRIWR